MQPRRGAVKDGRLLFAPHSLGRALDGLDARGRRAAALNQKLYGAALAVPMGLTTRVSAQGEALADGLAALSQGRADVVVLRVPEPADRDQPTTPTTTPGTPTRPAGPTRPGSPRAHRPHGRRS